jgi:hypothetical protein
MTDDELIEQMVNALESWHSCYWRDGELAEMLEQTDSVLQAVYAKHYPHRVKKSLFDQLTDISRAPYASILESTQP